MSAPPVVAFDAVSKRYPTIGTGSSRIRQALSRAPRPGSVALEDLSFTLSPGTSVGFIGPNGAGKTTALKLATRLTAPTEGRVRSRGRVAAMVAVSSGLHPDLTGRENVELYARILGLSPSALRARRDEIFAFADIGDAIDRPVKTYSSGMALRLGFAVSAFVDPDVFVIDEVLAVGDMAFQERCQARLRALRADGTSLLVVSHDLATVEMLCDHVIRLGHGRTVDEGPAGEVITRYTQDQLTGAETSELVLPVEGRGVRVLAAEFHDAAGRRTTTVHRDTTTSLALNVELEESADRPEVTLALVDDRYGIFWVASTIDDGGMPGRLPAGTTTVRCALGEIRLAPRDYAVWLSVRLGTAQEERLGFQPVARLRVVDVNGAQPPVRHWQMPFQLERSWSVEESPPLGRP